MNNKDDKRKKILRIVPIAILQECVDTFDISLSSMDRKALETNALQNWEDVEHAIFKWLNTAKIEDD